MKKNGIKQDKLYEVIRKIRPLFRHLWRAVEEELKGTGVTVMMRAVMELLHDEGPLAVPAIARLLFVERQSVQRIVDELIDKKLIERVLNPAHERSYLLELTGNGEKQLKIIKSKEQKNLGIVASDLSLEEIESCLRVISHTADSFSDLSKLKKGIVK